MAIINLDNLSAADLRRFAICYLCSDRTNVNWDAASAAYDPKVQVASFKTVTGRATSKILKEIEAAGDGEGVVPAAKPKKAAAGGKRKKAAAEEDGEEAPKPKKGRGRPKKAKSEEKIDSDGDEDAAGLIKAEEGEGEGAGEGAEGEE